MTISRQKFDFLLEQAIDDLPPQFAQWLDECPVIVEDEPSAEMRRDMGVDEDGDLLGSFNGVAITMRSVDEAAGLPAHIMIFRKPLMDMCESEEELADEIRITLLHELGHYAGFDEDDLERMGYA